MLLKDELPEVVSNWVSVMVGSTVLKVTSVLVIFVT